MLPFYPYRNSKITKKKKNAFYVPASKPSIGRNAQNWPIFKPVRNVRVSVLAHILVRYSILFLDVRTYVFLML